MQFLNSKREKRRIARWEIAMSFVWLTDVALQPVYKYSPDGRLLLTLGERGVAGRMPVISIALLLLPSQATARFT